MSGELRTALTAARAGGAAAMVHYGAVVAIEKAGGSPVTAADHASSNAILAHIGASFPDHAILCEETSDTRERLDARHVWIVDPLDGTKEFISENGEFSVMVGLIVDGVPTVGVVYLPATGVTYFAERDKGAWEQRSGVTRRLECAQANDLRAVVSRSHTDSAVDEICRDLAVTSRMASGSVGIKCALIAAGDADFYAHPVPYMGEWDTCAPEILLKEAGGQVTDCLGNTLQYNKEDTRQRQGILACAPGVMERALPVVARVFGERCQKSTV